MKKYLAIVALLISTQAFATDTKKMDAVKDAIKSAPKDAAPAAGSKSGNVPLEVDISEGHIYKAEYDPKTKKVTVLSHEEKKMGGTVAHPPEFKPDEVALKKSLQEALTAYAKAKKFDQKAATLGWTQTNTDQLKAFGYGFSLPFRFLGSLVGIH